MRASYLFWLCGGVIVACLLFGGGARSGYLSDTLIQLIAIPLFLASLLRLLDLPASKHTRWAMAFCLAIALVPILQLVPLSPRVWTALPNRETVAATYDLLGRELPWMPLSVSPRATWLSGLSLLPPLAIFLGMLCLDYRERRLLSLAMLAVGVVSVFVALIQLSQGSSSPLRFFYFGQDAEAAGFFANRNHFAALLYAFILFAAAWAVNAANQAASPTERGRDGKSFRTPSIVRLVASFTVIVIFVGAEIMARSRAGLGLTIVALFGAMAIALSSQRSTSGITASRLLLGAAALATVFAVQFALYRVLERFAVDPLTDARFTFARNTIQAAKAYMPFGSGMGTFVPVYAMFEKPEDLLLDAYANRAHNDILEVWLEAGAVGLALMGLFAIWFVMRSVKVWRHRPVGAGEIDYSLARAATIVVGLLIAHSLVDYPLRTGAMMAIAAFACALLIEPLAGSESETLVEPEEGWNSLGRIREAREASPQPTAASSPWPPPQALNQERGAPVARTPSGARWGEDIEWPEEWRKNKANRQSSDATPPSPGSRTPPRR